MSADCLPTERYNTPADYILSFDLAGEERERIKRPKKEDHTLSVVSRDENGSDTDRYHRYYICFHISVRIRIRIRIVSTMSDRI